jgi:hypothetical protein
MALSKFWISGPRGGPVSYCDFTPRFRPAVPPAAGIPRRAGSPSRYCDAMADIPDITETELWIFDTTLKERYGEKKDLELGDAEIRLSPADRELTVCPIVHWLHDNCNFVVVKAGERRYRAQFFYRIYQQYGTGRAEYDDLAECLVDLLQVQADYEARERGDLPDNKRR